MKTARILVVEDDPVSQKVLGLLLNHLGYQVDVAADGQQALELFEQKIYPIVFMDVGLPDSNGIDLTRTLRAYEAEHLLTPATIIALTAGSSHLKNDCMHAGMDDFLIKPILLEMLEGKLNSWLEQ